MRAIILGGLLVPAVALGQVVSNLNGTTTLVGPNYAVVDTLGAYQGTNLFHSFSTFNLTSAQSATFSGNAGTTNVIARVTGGASSIDGRIDTRTAMPSANLWLLNPRGFVFGQNAQLDVGGSFHAASASSLRFDTQGSWGMSGLPAASLTVDPTAFGFLGSPGPITVNGSVLAVDPTRHVTLAGGNLTLNGAVVSAPSGRINLASVTSAGELSLDANGLGVTGVSRYGAIAASNSIVLTELNGQPSGPIYIRGGSLTLNNAALSTLHNSNGAGSDIDINLTGDFTMRGGPLGVVRASSTGQGDAGNFTLRARNVSLANGAIIDTSGIDLNSFDGRGRAGETTILATGAVSLSGGSQISSITYTGTGAAGEMHIEGASLSMSGGSVLQASTYGDGAAGQITIDVGSLVLTGVSQIQAASIFDPRTTPGSGAGGNVIVNASGGVTISGIDAAGFSSGIFSITTSLGVGGNITVNADSINLDRGAKIATTSGLDNATGNLGGNAGSITLTANRVRLEGGSSVTTEAAFAGGGLVNIQAVDYVALSDSRITTSVAVGGGNGGDITIDPVFVVLDSSQIIARAIDGNGGNITINTQYFISSSDSVVDATSLFGQSGTVVINSPNTDSGSGLTVLPSAFFDPSNLLRASCAARGATGSTFIGAPRGGLPAGPESAAFASYGFVPAAATARAPRQVMSCVMS